MAEQIFSQNYYGGNQQIFKRFLAAEDAEGAYRAIQNFPSQEQDYIEEVKRIITIGEAHKALTEFLMHTERKQSTDGDLEKISENVRRSRL